MIRGRKNTLFVEEWEQIGTQSCSKKLSYQTTSHGILSASPRLISTGEQSGINDCRRIKNNKPSTPAVIAHQKRLAWSTFSEALFRPHGSNFNNGRKSSRLGYGHFLIGMSSPIAKEVVLAGSLALLPRYLHDSALFFSFSFPLTPSSGLML